MSFPILFTWTSSNSNPSSSLISELHPLSPRLNPATLWRKLILVAWICDPIRFGLKLMNIFEGCNVDQLVWLVTHFPLYHNTLVVLVPHWSVRLCLGPSNVVRGLKLLVTWQIWKQETILNEASQSCAVKVCTESIKRRIGLVFKRKWLCECDTIIMYIMLLGHHYWCVHVEGGG